LHDPSVVENDWRVILSGFGWWQDKDRCEKAGRKGWSETPSWNADFAMAITFDLSDEKFGRSSRTLGSILDWHRPSTWVSFRGAAIPSHGSARAFNAGPSQ
jgi:hypothetical protein